jgi:hypothetical protein
VIAKTHQPSDQHHTVVRFRGTHSKLNECAGSHGPIQKHEPNIVLLLSLAKYERDEVDYHHRMITNGLAIVVTVALMAMGVWLAVLSMSERGLPRTAVTGSRRSPAHFRFIEPLKFESRVATGWLHSRIGAVAKLLGRGRAEP